MAIADAESPSFTNAAIWPRAFGIRFLPPIRGTTSTCFGSYRGNDRWLPKRKVSSRYPGSAGCCAACVPFSMKNRAEQQPHLGKSIRRSCIGSGFAHRLVLNRSRIAWLNSSCSCGSCERWPLGKPAMMICNETRAAVHPTCGCQTPTNCAERRIL